MRFVGLVMLCSCSAVAPGLDAGFDAGTDAGVSYPPLTSAETTVLAARPYRLVVPASYDAGTSVPFVVLLHGYTATGLGQDMYFKLTELAQARTFLLATPDGLIDTSFQHYWNATDFCCGTIGTAKTDDVAYLTAILNDVRLRYSVDPRRVFFVGHSNGGFMSHRMACDRPERVAAIVSLAGAQWKDASLCRPDEPVSVLQVHGTADVVIAYAGTTEYPGAVDTVTDWARLDGCDAGTLVGAGANLDLDQGIGGSETKRVAFSGCATGAAVELWTIDAGSHLPNFNSSWAPQLYDWLMAHPKR